MTNRTVSTASWVWVLLGGMIALNAAAEATYLVKDGKARAEIVISDKPERGVTLAARELQTTLRKITGAELPIVTTPGTNSPMQIYVGRSVWTDKLGIGIGELKREAYKVVSGDKWLALIGNDVEFKPSEPWCKSHQDRPRMQAEWEKRTGKTWVPFDMSSFKAYNAALNIWMSDGVGSLYAVDDFLRSLGVEWYMPGDIGEVVPKMANVELPKAGKTVTPEIGYRGIPFVNFFSPAPGVSDDVLWYFRLGLGAPIPGFGHSMQVILSDPNNRTNHPEYYALYGGNRDFYSRGGKPCLSSEGLLREMTAYAKVYFDIYPEAPAFPIMPTDGYGEMCQCDLCKDKGTPGRGMAGSMSDYVWSFVNRVAGEIEKSHPGRKIGCCAYGTYLLPPEKIQFHTNVIVQICRWRQQDAWDLKNRALVLDIRNGWKSKLAPNSLYAWDYYLSSRRNDGLPIFFPCVIQQDLKSWKGDLQGEFVESWKDNNGRMASPGLNHLNAYVTARLYWNIDQDIDTLLDDYYRKFYGPASAQMKAFTEYCISMWPHMAHDKVVMDRMLALLGAARQAAGTGVYGQRIVLMEQDVEPIKAISESVRDRYVAQNGQMPAFPYTNWATAAGNIQDAVNAAVTKPALANASVTVWIGAGRYTAPTNAVDSMGANVVFVDRPLILRSSNGVAKSVTIDGGGSNRCVAVKYQSASINPFVIDGITLSNGFSSNSGGGLCIVPGVWTGLVQNCVIAGNTAVTAGGGIAIPENGAKFHFAISNCVLRGNRAGSGGGMDSYLRAYGGGSGAMSRCLVESNTATTGSGGGLLVGDAAFSLDSCVIRGNGAGSHGGGIHSRGGVFSARHCLIENNKACNRSSYAYGGGLFAEGSSNVLVNCTVAGNRAGGNGTSGLLMNDGRIVNSIICNNGEDGTDNVHGKVSLSNSCTNPPNAHMAGGQPRLNGSVDMGCNHGVGPVSR